MKRFALAAVVAFAPLAVFAEGVAHKVAIHVDQNDPQVMNMALNNAANVASYYESQGDTVTIEMVTYGPGLNMLIADKSPVAQRISAMSLEMDNISFSACANTMAGMKKKTGHDVVLLSEATVVPSGVVRLIELQEDGFAYVRP
ncbi:MULTISPECIES: DsrE family protein [unclassified Sulfitobacter]|jgi:intracellular sulfur oxidation DsrE/DsrF family protein|uniref:DsrE family protein n=1 Tax=unclassified Sulfitobacter TaxID=196795 RepID=UPI0015938E58|nr:DsrE family protein [Sulfitobacter sp. HGT1]MBQ0804218.1 DsrE family protein [Sulfitobacter sp.]